MDVIVLYYAKRIIMLKELPGNCREQSFQTVKQLNVKNLWDRNGS